MTTVLDLGQVSSIKISSTPPTNTKLLWYDTNIIEGIRFKYYDISSESWQLVGVGDLINDLIIDTDKTWSSSKIQSELSTYIPLSQKGSINGVTPLGSDSKVPAMYLPSYVDDILEFANLASFPITGEPDKVYIALDTNKTYRWSGSTYVEVSPSDVNSVNGQTGIVSLTTANIPEFTNLYYTDARARAAISLTTTGSSGAATYNSSTGILNIPQYADASGSGSYIQNQTSLTQAADFKISGDGILNTITTQGDIITRNGNGHVFWDATNSYFTALYANGGGPSNYVITLPLANGTVALTSDIPNSSSYIQNQTASTQTADFKISGTGIFGAGTSSATSIRGTNQSANTGIYFSGSTGIAMAFSGSKVFEANLSGIGITGTISSSALSTGLVKSNSSGVLSNAVAGVDYLGGSGTANYIPKFSSSGTFANSSMIQGTWTVGFGGAPGAYDNVNISIYSLGHIYTGASIQATGSITSFFSMQAPYCRVRPGTSNGDIKGTNLTNNRVYELPDASGTVALTSDIASSLTGYLPLTAGVTKPLTDALYGTSATFSGTITATGDITASSISLSNNISATGLNSTGQATLGSLNQGGKMNFVSGGTGAVGGTLGFSTNATTNILSLQNIQGLELTSTNSNGYVAVRATGANGAINFRTGSNINGYVHPSGNWSFQNGGTYTDNGYRIDVNGTGRFTSTLTANSFVKSGGTSSQFLKADGSVDGNSYALTSSLSGYLPLSGGTLTGALTGTSATFSGLVTGNGAFRSNVFQLFTYSAGRGGLYTYDGVLGGGTDYNPTLYSEGDIYFASGGTATKKLIIASTGTVSLTEFNGAVYYGLTINTNNNSGSQYLIDFQRQGAQAGYIASSSSTTVGIFNTSDYRSKEDFLSFSGTKLLKEIKFYDFKWKGENCARDYGVIAHELQGVLPNAVLGKKDGEKYQAVDYVKLIPILGQALKDAIERIEALEAEVKLLKSK